jgi:hypothetical protein
MNLKLLGVAVGAIVTACVSTPEGVPSIYKTEGHGQPLAGSEIVALYLSTSLASSDSKQVTGSTMARDGDSVRPVQDKGAAYKALTEGFLSVRPDVQVVVQDESLHQACFDTGERLVMDDEAILVRLEVNRTSCREMIDERRIRYFVSFAGWSATASTTAAEAFGVGVGVSTERVHWFKFVAHAFDAVSGAAVCEERAVETARSRQGGGITLLPAPPVVLPLPLIWVTTVDEPAFFARAAWLAGARAGMCFVESAKTESNPSSAIVSDGGAEPTHRRWCLIAQAANSVTCEIDAYEDCQQGKFQGRGRALVAPPRGRTPSWSKRNARAASPVPSRQPRAFSCAR